MLPSMEVEESDPTQPRSNSSTERAAQQRCSSEHPRERETRPPKTWVQISVVALHILATNGGNLKVH